MTKPQHLESQAADSSLAELTVTVSESLRGGEWTDYARVSNTPDGFTIDFVANDPGDIRQGVLVARLRMSSRMAMRLSETLRATLEEWGDRELKYRKTEVLPKGASDDTAN